MARLLWIGTPVRGYDHVPARLLVREVHTTMFRWHAAGNQTGRAVQVHRKVRDQFVRRLVDGNEAHGIAWFQVRPGTVPSLRVDLETEADRALPICDWRGRTAEDERLRVL